MPYLMHHAELVPIMLTKASLSAIAMMLVAHAMPCSHDCSAKDCVVPARGKALVPTDLSIKTPPGTYGRVAPRSGLAWKHSIDVGAGVIDEDYRGPRGVILFNHSDVEFTSESQAGLPGHNVLGSPWCEREGGLYKGGMCRLGC